MLRFALVLAVMLLGCVAGRVASAAPQVSIEPRFPSEGYYSAQFKECDGETEDALKLTVSDHSKQLVNKDFCSSYGRASARLVTDKSNQTFVLLEYSEGRGNGQAVTNYLEIDRLQQKDFLEVLRLPISWATSFSQRYNYSYVVELPASGGLRIRLKGQNLGQPSPMRGDGCCVADSGTITIDIEGR